jgi:hypothetical protein
MWMTLCMIVVVMLSACASPVQMEKVGATPLDMKNDQYDCRQQWDASAGAIAYRLDPLAHLNELHHAGEYMQACFERKGWSRVVQ